MPTPKFEPTKEERDQIQALAAFGIEQKMMCGWIKRPASSKNPTLRPISLRTLQRHFATELDMGLPKLLATAAQSLVARMADKKDKSGAAAAMFLLKCRGGWRERAQQHEHTGPDGAPIPFELDLAGASDEELAVIGRFLKRKAEQLGQAVDEPANDQAAA